MGVGGWVIDFSLHKKLIFRNTFCCTTELVVRVGTEQLGRGENGDRGRLAADPRRW